MRPHRPFRPRCLAAGLILAWIVALYASYALIAAFEAIPGYRGRGVGDITWELTDQVSFAAKLACALSLTALLLGSRLVPLPRVARVAADAVLGALAMLLVLILIPEQWSAGFGIGLTGLHLDPATLPFYLLGGTLSGLAYTLADAKCRELRHYDDDPSTA